MLSAAAAALFMHIASATDILLKQNATFQLLTTYENQSDNHFLPQRPLYLQNEPTRVHSWPVAIPLAQIGSGAEWQHSHSHLGEAAHLPDGLGSESPKIKFDVHYLPTSNKFQLKMNNPSHENHSLCFDFDFRGSSWRNKAHFAPCSGALWDIIQENDRTMLSKTVDGERKCLGSANGTDVDSNFWVLNNVSCVSDDCYGPEQTGYYADYSNGPENSKFVDHADAKEFCRSNENCGAVTQEANKMYTTRAASRVFYANDTTQRSWLKNCTQYATGQTASNWALNFEIAPDGGSASSLSTGAIVGIAFGATAGVGLLGFCIYRIITNSADTKIEM